MGYIEIIVLGYILNAVAIILSSIFVFAIMMVNSKDLKFLEGVMQLEAKYSEWELLKLELKKKGKSSFNTENLLFFIPFAMVLYTIKLIIGITTIGLPGFLWSEINDRINIFKAKL
jgi:hypothetical protein